MDPIVERHIDLEASPAEVWSVVRQPEAWLADEGSLDLRPGGVGRLTDGGVTRRALVESVDDGRRLVYRWWDEDGGAESATRVEITVLPAAGGTRVAVRETPIAASAALADVAPVEARWDLRLLCLGCLAWSSLTARV